MEIFTIGFTKKSARTFFGLLRDSGARAVIDVRLHNVSQLAGFAKRDDLAFFLDRICGMDYVHVPLLAPTQELLDDFRKHGTRPEVFEERFLDLMHERRVETAISRELVDNAVLLCGEEKPDHCHRRFVAEYLRAQWGDVAIHHLG